MRVEPYIGPPEVLSISSTHRTRHRYCPLWVNAPTFLLTLRARQPRLAPTHEPSLQLIRVPILMFLRMPRPFFG
jgi:hypothetical protein